MSAILQDMIEQVGRSAMAADPTDLAGLADMHTQLEALAAAALAAPASTRLPESVEAARKALEVLAKLS